MEDCFFLVNLLTNSYPYAILCKYDFCTDYEALKKALKIKELSIENSMEQRNGGMLLVSLKPEPIPLDLLSKLADFYGISVDELIGREVKKNW